MIDYRLTEAEERMANLIWQYEPIKSGELVGLCQKEFQWKKSTTYTMLKRLEDKKIFHNDSSIVISLIKKDDFYSEQSNIFVRENFGGSLPKFVAAFTRRSRLSQSEVHELERLINEYKED